MEYELVVIGASWGGLHAVGTVLDGLGEASNAAIVVGQHRGVAGGERLAPLLQRRTHLAVREAEDKEPLLPGSVSRQTLLSAVPPLPRPRQVVVPWFAPASPTKEPSQP